MGLSDNLKSQRKKAKLTQTALSNILNIERSTYSYYETGKTRPTYETLLRLAKYYNTSVDSLLGNESPLMVSDNHSTYDTSASLSLTAEEKTIIMKLRGLDKESVTKVIKVIDDCLSSSN